MELEDYLNQIDERFINEEISDDEALDELMEAHQSVFDNEEQLLEFTETVLYICGGLFIPYIFWIELQGFLSDAEQHRPRLHNILRIFTESNFEEKDRSRMKPLLIIYFSNEKEFEVDKVRALIIDKAHPKVKDYFNKILIFVDKNRDTVQTYRRKLEMLKDYYPDFALLNEPIAKLSDMVRKMQ